jgi:outer membrane lipoprotein-sorting protein
MIDRSMKLGLFVLIAAGLIHAADPADAVFARIDSAAKTFRGLTADLTDTEHNALINSDDVNKGVAKFLREKPGSMRALITWNNESGSLEYNGKEGKLYNPKTNTVDVVNLSNKQGTVNKYLALGFGATSAELKASFDVTYLGEETVAGQPASHLKLVPKTHDPGSSLKQADLWYGANGLVVQQKTLAPSGDYKLMLYTNMKLGSMPEKELEIKLPKGVTVQKH